MLSINWINILLIISGCISSILLFNVAYKAKSLSNLFFGLSILFLLIGIITGMIVTDYTDVANEWGELLAMASLLCGLFVKPGTLNRYLPDFLYR